MKVPDEVLERLLGGGNSLFVHKSDYKDYKAVGDRFNFRVVEDHTGGVTPGKAVVIKEQYLEEYVI